MSGVGQLKSLEFLRMLIHLQDSGIIRKIHVEAFGAENLWHEKAVGGGDGVAETKITSCFFKQTLQGREADVVPVGNPFIFAFWGGLKMFLKLIQDGEILQRLNAAVDGFTDLNNDGSVMRVVRKKRRVWAYIFEVLEDSHRLADGLTVVYKARNLREGIEALEFI